MPDDLVNRICKHWIDAGYGDECFCQMYPGCSAKENSLTPRMVFDRIEILKAENHLLKTAGIIEVASRNPNVMEYMRHWEGRAEAAEAKLAKAVGGLKEISDRAFEMNSEEKSEFCDAVNDMEIIAFSTLAQLRGDKDE